MQVGIAQRCEGDILATTLKVKVSLRRHRGHGPCDITCCVHTLVWGSNSEVLGSTA